MVRSISLWRPPPKKLLLGRRKKWIIEMETKGNLVWWLSSSDGQGLGPDELLWWIFYANLACYAKHGVVARKSCSSCNEILIIICLSIWPKPVQIRHGNVNAIRSRVFECVCRKKKDERINLEADFRFLKKQWTARLLPHLIAYFNYLKTSRGEHERNQMTENQPQPQSIACVCAKSKRKNFPCILMREAH